MNLHNRIYTWYPRSLWLSKGDWSSIHQFGVQQKILKNVLYPKHPHPIPQQYTPTHIQQLRQATTMVTELIEWVSKVAVICLKLCATIADPSSPFPLALPHFCGFLLKGDVLQAMFENVYYDLKTHNNAWAEDCWLVLFYVLFQFNAFICMESWMLSKVTIFIIVCFFAFLSNR